MWKSQIYVHEPQLVKDGVLACSLPTCIMAGINLEPLTVLSSNPSTLEPLLGNKTWSLADLMPSDLEQLSG
ncbi:hypothetical protein EB796_012126 [Bugula neritina]|uniref:Uncharacterized protein n=1 Tax=Bugula neritina TaxID=10212 RepID=A0A7J7JUC7_BUGNE|nr:hypothetical protein EB796_012126 [Bugula neritina]